MFIDCEDPTKWDYLFKTTKWKWSTNSELGICANWVQYLPQSMTQFAFSSCTLHEPYLLMKTSLYYELLSPETALRILAPTCTQLKEKYRDHIYLVCNQYYIGPQKHRE